MLSSIVIYKLEPLGREHVDAELEHFRGQGLRARNKGPLCRGQRLRESRANAVRIEVLQSREEKVKLIR